MTGVYGEVSNDDCVEDVYYGADYHSHLGTVHGGLVFYKDNDFQRKIHDISSHPFRSRFSSDIKKMKGNMGLGVISDLEAQPLISSSQLGKYAIVHVGRVNNLDNIAGELMSRGASFAEDPPEGLKYNPTELVACLIDQGKDYLEGISFMQDNINGSSSVMLLTDDGIYLARDRLGRTPIVIGKREEDGSFAATLETSAFPNLNVGEEGMGFKVERYLGPGEIGKLTNEGYNQLKEPGSEMQICSFLWVYYGYPTSFYEGINVEEMRYKSGAIHAEIDMKDGLEVDIISGIPDSGTGHAIGYANKRGIPFMRPYVKYTPSWPRSFMPQKQEVRDLIGRMKLIPNIRLIKGKRLLFCEDSIVRGTQLQNTIRRLYDYGAEEVHMRPACPPLLYGCKFLNFSISKSESQLAGRKAITEIEGEGAKVYEYTDENSENFKKMVERVRKRLGLTTLRYQRLEDMISAIGLPKEKLCTYCWDGCERCK